MEQEQAQVQQNLQDIEIILSHRYDQGWDYWTTPDKRLSKGGPFSALECPIYLLDLGVSREEDYMKEVVDLIFSTWREDGRFKLYPKGGIYPCHTINAVRTLCYMGYAEDERIQKTIKHLLDIQHSDGGWRCNKFSFGKGPETAYSNPHPTLFLLDALRFTAYANKDQRLDHAVEFLLEHWSIKMPMGPCHYGIGTLFMQVEYPFRNYNLFEYVYVLSFYEKARKDVRFLEAFEALRAKTAEGMIVIERLSPKLKELSFCKKGQTSLLGTKRYNEILFNLESFKNREPV